MALALCAVYISLIHAGLPSVARLDRQPCVKVITFLQAIGACVPNLCGISVHVYSNFGPVAVFGMGPEEAHPSSSLSVYVDT